MIPEQDRRTADGAVDLEQKALALIPEDVRREVKEVLRKQSFHTDYNAEYLEFASFTALMFRELAFMQTSDGQDPSVPMYANALLRASGLEPMFVEESVPSGIYEVLSRMMEDIL